MGSVWVREFSSPFCNDYCVLLQGSLASGDTGGATGERRRKSVRGCIVSPDLSVLNLVIVKQGQSVSLLG